MALSLHVGLLCVCGPVLTYSLGLCVRAILNLDRTNPYINPYIFSKSLLLP